MALNKRFLSIIMIAVMIIMYMPAHAFAKDDSITSGKAEDWGCDWVLDKNGTLTISAGTMLDWGIFPPWHEDSEKITKVQTTGTVVLSTARNMFESCTSLKSVDLSNFITSNVTEMHEMFNNCYSLSSINLSNLDTRNVTGMFEMFSDCRSLKSIIASNFDTSNVTTMYQMFRDCHELRTLDLSSFDTRNVKDMGGMIYMCPKLTRLITGKNWVYSDEVKDEAYPSFYVQMKDTSTGTVFEPFDMVPEISNRTYEATYRSIQQIDYDKDTWNFKNFKEKITFKEFERFFTPFVAQILYQRNKNSEGNCYGMCMLIPSIIEYGFPENLSGKKIHSLEKTGEVKQWIKYAFIAQMLPDIIEEEAENTNDYEGLIKAIKECSDGTGSAAIVSIGNHELLPVSILEETDSEVRIDMYDCNYPNHEDENGYPSYTTLVLYGENGKYSSCYYYLSPEQGAYTYDKYMKIQELSYSTMTDSFISAYKNKVQADYNAWAGATANSKIGRLFSTKNSLDISFSDITSAYPINLKTGAEETAEDSLFWIKDDDDQMSVTGIAPGDEITLASDHNSISIKVNNEASVSLKVNENQSSADISMDTPGMIEIECLSGDETITGISTTLKANDNATFIFEGGTISTTGVTGIEIDSKKGTLDDEGELNGGTETYSADNIDPNNEYTIEVKPDDNSHVDPSPVHQHSFTAWKTKKAATELATGIQARNCSVCGKIETKAIAKLKPSLKAVKILAPKAAKKAATVKWKMIKKNDLKRIKKVEIQYSTDKNFKKNVKTKYAKASKIAYKIKNLKKGKKYYIRIRAYTKSGRKVHISKWSARKQVKVK